MNDHTTNVKLDLDLEEVENDLARIATALETMAKNSTSVAKATDELIGINRETLRLVRDQYEVKHPLHPPKNESPSDFLKRLTDPFPMAMLEQQKLTPTPKPEVVIPKFIQLFDGSSIAIEDIKMTKRLYPGDYGFSEYGPYMLIVKNFGWKGISLDDFNKVNNLLKEIKQTK